MNKALNKIYKFIATGLGVGYIPFAPGTFGALMGCILWIIFIKSGILNIYSSVFIVLSGFIIGVFVSDKLEKEWGKDPSKVVIDEVVGMWISMIMQPFSIPTLIVAFIAFRFFDISKVLFVSKMEKLKGGWGVMADDALAGIYANMIVFIYRLIA